jgi:delta-1-pyrroline-5-carboxylate synthetase
MDEAARAQPRRSLRLARRIIIKVGTPVVTHVDGNLALGRIGALVEQIARLRHEGRDCVIVTSGAIGTGTLRMRKTMTLNSTMRDAIQRQLGTGGVNPAAASAVGQALLMNMYETLFSKYNLSCAQVLITEDDVKNPETLAQVCETTMELMQLGTVPIINDNDAITQRALPVFDDQTDEIRWDNDVLASRLATGLRADLLVMLTDLDALYAEPPNAAALDGEADAADAAAEPMRLSLYTPEAKLVRTGIASSAWMLSDNGRGFFVGRTRMAASCMQDMVEATVSAIDGGVHAAVVTTGHHPLSLLRIVKGEDIGTLFIAGGATSAAASLPSKL